MEHSWENLLRRAAVPDFTLGGEGAGNQGDWGSLIFNKNQVEESMVLPSRHMVFSSLAEQDLAC